MEILKQRLPVADGGDGGFPGEGEGLEGFGGNAIFVQIDDDFPKDFKQLFSDGVQFLNCVAVVDAIN